MEVRTKGNDKYRIMAEINMIPLIDVALVLLIIFMVITPVLVRSQIKINLPTGQSADQASARDEAVEVQVARDGVVYIGGLSVKAEDVEPALRRALLHPDTQPVVIHADKDVPFQHVVTVMSAARKIGANKLGVGIRPESTGGVRKPKGAGKTP